MEDFTGRGVDDLRAGIVRTPLPPLETFCDDPLRVLRSIRFAARFGFRCEQDLLNAAAAQVVRDALHSKISRERIGKELSLMMTGPRIDVAVALLQQVELWNAVFKLPDSLCTPADDVTVEKCSAYKSVTFAGDDGRSPSWDGTESVQIVSLLLAHEKIPEVSDPNSELTRKCVLLAALLYPLHHLEYVVPKKKKRNAATCFVVLDSLKLSCHEAESALLIQNIAFEFSTVISKILDCGNASAALPRGPFGMLLRKAGSSWQYALALAACSMIADGGVPADIWSAKSAILSLYETYQLGSPWEQRPLITVCIWSLSPSSFIVLLFLSFVFGFL